MLILIDMLTALLPLLYGLAAVNYLVFYLRQEPFAQRTCTPFLTAVFLLHLTFLIARYIHFERYPIASLAEAVSVIALAITGVYLYVERVQANKATGVFIVGLVTLTQLVASGLLPHMQPTPGDILDVPLLAAHVTTAVLAYSAFGVGAVYGLMFLLLYRVLKRKTFGLMFERLPPLDVTASMGVWANFLGWLLLTVAIALGAIMSLRLFPNFYRDPKFVSTLFVWTVYGGALVAYRWVGWRGARTAALSLAGFGVAVLATMGSALLWPTFHSFSG